MLKSSLTWNGRLLAQVAASPPSHTEATLGSDSTAPVSALQDSVDWFTLPLPGHEQLGLQQSQ
jgi:hypothetical protein